MKSFAVLFVVAAFVAGSCVANDKPENKEIVTSSYGGGGSSYGGSSSSYSAPAPQQSYSAPAPQQSYSAPAPQQSYSAPAPQQSYSAPAPQQSYGSAPASIPAPPCPKNYLFSCQPNLAPVPCSSPSSYGSSGSYSHYVPNYALPPLGFRY